MSTTPRTLVVYAESPDDFEDKVKARGWPRDHAVGVGFGASIVGRRFDVVIDHIEPEALAWLLREDPARLAPRDLPPCCTPPRRARPLPSDYFERVGYAGYNAGGDPETAGLTYQGKPCPEWEGLTENVRLKWGSGRADMARAFLFELQLELDYELAPVMAAEKTRILAAMARLMGVEPPPPRRQPED